MIEYIARRLIGALPILFGVILLTFLLLQMIPGDPAVVLAGERATEEQVERIREELGLNDPLPVQFGRFIWSLAQLDLGRSLLTDRPVWTELSERFPATLELSIYAMAFATLLGLGLGTVAAAYKHRWIDTVAIMIALAGVSIPIFWLGLELVYYFAYELRWFPTAGRGPEPEAGMITGLYTLDALLSGNLNGASRSFQYLALPSFTLGLLASALIARMTRATLIEIFDQDFIRTARSKGTGRLQVWRHAFSAGFVPVLTVFGLQLGTLLGGAVLTEHVFSWPGLGSFLVQAVFARDIPTIQALVLLSSVIFVGANLAVDLISALFDPRIRARFENA